jgi:hypothetical protein
MAGNIEAIYFLNESAYNLLFSVDNNETSLYYLILKTGRFFCHTVCIYVFTLCIVMNIVRLANRDILFHNIFLKIEINLIYRKAYVNE